MEDFGRGFNRFLRQHQLEVTTLGHYRKSGRKSKTSEATLVQNGKLRGQLVSNPYGGPVTWGVYLFNEQGEVVVRIEDIEEDGYIKLRKDLLELARHSQDMVIRPIAFALHALMYTSPSRAMDN